MENVILGFLTIKEMTGYDIKKLMSTSTNYFFDASFGSIYPILKNLEKDGCVVSREVLESKKVRTLYSITTKGRKKFLDWLESPATVFKLRYEFLTKLFFSSNLPKAKVLTLVKAHIEEIKEEINQLKLIDEATKIMGDRFHRYTIKFGLDYFNFLVSWYEELILDIETNRDIQGENPVCNRRD